ncbi:MAG: transglutaminase family protein [Thiohalocapsa sp.]
MRYRIERTDRARFSSPVREHHFECRILPWADEGQRLEQIEIGVDPAAEVASHRDGFGNQLHSAALLGAHDDCSVRMVAEVNTLLMNPFQFDAVAPAREPLWISDSLRQAPRLWDFVLHRSALTPEIETLPLRELVGENDGAALGWRPGLALLTQSQEACDWTKAEFEHDPAQSSVTALGDLVERRGGTSADLTHLLIAIVRSWGMPARFVSGYLDPGYFDPDDDDPADVEPRPQTLHCWMEVLIPGGGWRGFDPAHGLVADDTYIRLAVGRDFSDLTGFRQSFKGNGESEEVETEIDVRRLD